MQACSDEFCEYYPHNLIPNPGYWIECSRVVCSISNINIDKDLEEAEEEEGSFESMEETDGDPSERAKSLPIIQEPNCRKKSIIEEHWSKYGSFEVRGQSDRTFQGQRTTKLGRGKEILRLPAV